LPRELKPIAARLNDLLGRVQDAFERERRFTSSAAHELRTPVAEVRALAEVGLRFPTDGGKPGPHLREIVSVAQDMEHTIAALLSMARAGSASQPLEITTFDVGRLVEEHWARRADRAARRALRVRCRVGAGLRVESDAAALA
jgi:signal transduction histidine kinase